MKAHQKEIIVYLLVGIFVLFDLFWLILTIIDIQLIILKKSYNSIPIMVHVLLLILLFKNRTTKTKIFISLGLILCIYFLGKSLLGALVTDNKYKEACNPATNKCVIVEYHFKRNYEFTAYYRVYQRKWIFMEEKTKKAIVERVPRDWPMSETAIFDLTPKWKKNKTVIFQALDGEHKFLLD